MPNWIQGQYYSLPSTYILQVGNFVKLVSKLYMGFMSAELLGPAELLRLPPEPSLLATVLSQMFFCSMRTGTSLADMPVVLRR